MAKHDAHGDLYYEVEVFGTPYPQRWYPGRYGIEDGFNIRLSSGKIQPRGTWKFHNRTLYRTMRNRSSYLDFLPLTVHNQQSMQAPEKESTDQSIRAPGQSGHLTATENLQAAQEERPQDSPPDAAMTVDTDASPAPTHAYSEQPAEAPEFLQDSWDRFPESYQYPYEDQPSSIKEHIDTQRQTHGISDYDLYRVFRPEEGKLHRTSWNSDPRSLEHLLESIIVKGKPTDTQTRLLNELITGQWINTKDSARLQSHMKNFVADYVKAPLAEKLSLDTFYDLSAHKQRDWGIASILVGALNEAVGQEPDTSRTAYYENIDIAKDFKVSKYDEKTEDPNYGESEWWIQQVNHKAELHPVHDEVNEELFSKIHPFHLWLDFREDEASPDYVDKLSAKQKIQKDIMLQRYHQDVQLLKELGITSSSQTLSLPMTNLLRTLHQTTAHLHEQILPEPLWTTLRSTIQKMEQWPKATQTHIRTLTGMEPTISELMTVAEQGLTPSGALTRFGKALLGEYADVFKDTGALGLAGLGKVATTAADIAIDGIASTTADIATEALKTAAPFVPAAAMSALAAGGPANLAVLTAMTGSALANLGGKALFEGILPGGAALVEVLAKLWLSQYGIVA